MMKTAFVLLALGSLTACTTTRIDDHSYHSSATPPANRYSSVNNYYSQPRPQYTGSFSELQEADQEYLQYSQGPSRQSSYSAPQQDFYPTQRYCPPAPRVYCPPPAPRVYCPPPAPRIHCTPVYHAPQYRPQYKPQYKPQYNQPSFQPGYIGIRGSINLRYRN